MATDSRPLVVLAGPIHPDGKTLLEEEARVVVCDDETEAGLVEAAAEAQGILFRIRPRCTESLMAACGKLRVVGRHGVGLDTVDIPAATRLGIAVVHAPGSNSQAVAEHALMLMLVAVKRTLAIDKAMRKDGWSTSRAGSSELGGKPSASSAWATSAGASRSSPARSGCASLPTTSTWRTTRCYAAVRSR
jgi:phosphoglycerate dehydrogenase-like enzyme